MRHLMTSRALPIAILAAAGGALGACTGILGLDQTSLSATGGPDAADDTNTPPVGDDAAPDAISNPGADASTPPGDDGGTTTTDATSPPTVDGATPPLGEGGPPEASTPKVDAGPPGTPDGTFQGGYAVDMAAPMGTVFNAVAVDASGRIVAGGTGGGGTGWILHRFLDSGLPDVAFDNAIVGKLPATGALTGLTIDPANGLIICTGSSGSTVELTIAIVDASGNLSGAFHGGTLFVISTVAAGGGGSTGAAVSLATAGNFIGVGNVTQSGTGVLTELCGRVVDAERPEPVPGRAARRGPRDHAIEDRRADRGRERLGARRQRVHRALHRRRDDRAELQRRRAGHGDERLQGLGRRRQPHVGGILISGTNGNGSLPGCYEAWDSTGVFTWTRTGAIGGGGPFTYTALAPVGGSSDLVYAVGSGGDSFARSARLERIAITDGVYDTTFGPAGTGYVALGDTSGASPPAFYFTLQADAVDALGRVVIAGSRTDSSGTFALVGRFWP